MLSTALIVGVLATANPTAPPEHPRTCPHCGTYGGPNAHLVYDPLILQVDVWPDFVSASCRFEVAAHRFVTLGRTACAAERSYRARNYARFSSPTPTLAS